MSYSESKVALFSIPSRAFSSALLTTALLISALLMSALLISALLTTTLSTHTNKRTIPTLFILVASFTVTLPTANKIE